MTSTATGGTTPTGPAERMGLKPGMVVQELGWDSDTDDALRLALEDAIDGELIEEAMDAVDVVLLWWRDDDGDLIDGLVEAVVDLSASGPLWLLTPKIGRSGYVDNSDISEAAVTAGLALTTSANVSPDWAAHKLVRPRGTRR